jgi:hypothetical protein
LFYFFNFFIAVKFFFFFLYILWWTQISSLCIVSTSNWITGRTFSIVAVRCTICDLGWWFNTVQGWIKYFAIITYMAFVKVKINFTEFDRNIGINTIISCRVFNFILVAITLRTNSISRVFDTIIYSRVNCFALIRFKKWIR